MKRPYLVAIALLFISPLARAQGLGTTTVTNQVGVTVAAEAALTIGAGVTNLTSIGTNFSDYTGTTSFTYFIRTGKAAGTGFIKLEVTTDFSPTGGPSLANPLTSGDILSYVPTLSSPATAASGSQVASLVSQTAVGTFATDAHSTKAGNTASVDWTLSNDPLYQTGTFTAVVTYTISAS